MEGFQAVFSTMGVISTGVEITPPSVEITPPGVEITPPGVEITGVRGGSY